MKITGVVAEYDPFHLGHWYQLQEARKKTDADAVCAVMSGFFTQRGHAAVVSPFVRARMALQSGADLVLLLPTLYAVRDGEHFAAAGVHLLSLAGADTISFGAETDDATLLEKAAVLLNHPTEMMNEMLHRLLDEGVSYPAAMQKALAAEDENAAQLLDTPNNMLAIGYLRAIAESGANMHACPIRREGGYHDTAHTSGYASASSIRASLYGGDWLSVRKGMGEENARLLETEALAGQLLNRQRMDNALMYRLRMMTRDDFAALPDLSEGLDDRLYKCSREALTATELMEKLKTRRYTYARLNRLLTHALLGITQKDMEISLPQTLLLLGMNEKGRQALSAISARGTRIITRAAELRDCDEAWVETEKRAAAVWASFAGADARVLEKMDIVRMTEGEIVK